MNNSKKTYLFLLRKRTILHFSQLSNNKRIIIYGNGNFWFIQFLIWKDLYIQYKESIQQRKSNKKQLKQKIDDAYKTKIQK